MVAIAAMALMFLVACSTQPQSGDDIIKGSGGINAEHQQTKPYLILIPVFLTLTFPNHFSIATSLYPAHHGLVANDFPDPARNTWYSLEKACKLRQWSMAMPASWLKSWNQTGLELTHKIHYQYPVNSSFYLHDRARIYD